VSERFDPAAILEVLAEERVDFLVIGGVAAGLYGSNRSTFDLDIVPAPGLRNARRLERALARLEARFRGVDADLLGIDLDAETLAAGANFTLTTHSGDLDVMPITEGDRSWEELSQRAVTMQLREGLPIQLVSRDDLIALKRAAGRRQDIEDIVQLTAGEYLARHARAGVRLTGKLNDSVSDEEAHEIADIALSSYENDVRVSVHDDSGTRRLSIEAELDGFARSHAEIWASIVAGKTEAQGIIDGAIEQSVQV
jgi:hypothetical protein